MAQPLRILVLTAGAAVLGAFLTAALLANSSAQAQHASGGVYTMMHHSNTNAVAGVFQMNAETGAIRYCFLSEQKGAVLCTAPNMPGQ